MSLVCSFLVEVQLVCGLLWKSSRSVQFWEEVGSLVNGYENILHKGYNTREQAEEAY
jgi:hypothetical protein